MRKILCILMGVIMTIYASKYPYDSVFPQHESYGEGIGAMRGRVVWNYDTDYFL